MTQLTNQSNDQIEAKLPGQHRAFIRRVDASLGFDEPVYAVNWFNSRFRWLYDLYNVLAAGSVAAIGGAPFFKGSLIEKLHGTESDRRDLILVVRYPALNQFKTMLENKYFQFLSFLRVFAVKDFTFGFVKRSVEDTPLEPVSKNAETEQVYLVHHFKGDQNIVEELMACGRQLGIETVFVGKISAVVATGTSGASDVTQTPCLMDAIIIFKAVNQTSVEAVHQSDGYQSAISKSSSSFVGTYRRTL